MPRRFNPTVRFAALLAAILCGLSAAPPALAKEPELIPVDAAGLLAAVRAPGAQATIVNVWASFCVPCRHEFPALLKVWREHQARGVRLVLVTTDLREDLPAAREYLARQGVDFPSYVKNQSDMEFINGIHEPWSGSIPATLVYDARGRLVTFIEGEASEQEFRDAVRQALGGKEKM